MKSTDIKWLNSSLKVPPQHFNQLDVWSFKKNQGVAMAIQSCSEEFMVDTMPVRCSSPVGSKQTQIKPVCSSWGFGSLSEHCMVASGWIYWNIYIGKTGNCLVLVNNLHFVWKWPFNSGKCYNSLRFYLFS